MILYGKNCNECGIELNSENCHNGAIKNKHYKCIKCRSNLAKIQRIEIKKKVILAYGNECVCCQENNFEFMTIDHIFSDGAIERKENGGLKGTAFYEWLIKNNFPQDRYQLMCWNCNRGKYIGNCCPHQLSEPINIEKLNIKHNYDNKIGAENKVCTNCGIIVNQENVHKLLWNNKSYICKKCQTSKITYRNLKIKIDVFENYGNACVCCNENNISFLNIDHIDGSGSKHRKEIGVGGGAQFYYWLKNNNYPKDNFQLLCSNCNSSKHFYGYCPHQKENNKIIT